MANWANEARAAAQSVGLDPDLFERQIRQESANYDPDVISGRRNSSAGAQGIAQFMPSTARGLGINPLNPRQALRGAARLMKSYVSKYGNYRDALVAYNAGPGRVGGSLPAETQKYIQIIMGNSGGGSVSSPGTGVKMPSLTVPGPVKAETAPDTIDTKSAILDVLRSHKKGSRLKQYNALIQSGRYTVPGETRNVPAGDSITVGGNTVGGSDVMGTVQQIAARAEVIDKQRRTYKYGGGHQGGRISINDVIPVDCSAAVAMALNIPVRTSGDFANVGKPGKGLVNLYFNSGHILMGVVLNGVEHFWGTSRSNPGGGAGWIKRDQITPGYLSRFQVRHVA